MRRARNLVAIMVSLVVAGPAVAVLTADAQQSSAATAVSVGIEHTCALTTTGGLMCWGDNSEGQLGDGTTTDRVTPVNVAGLTNGVAAVSVGGAHTCALTTTGGLRCWGSNSEGELGDGTTTNRIMPVNVAGLASGVAAVSAGSSHTCALTTTGGLRCWGINSEGQLGDGTTTDRITPVNVAGLTSGVAAVSAGFRHTCAQTTTGGLKCWGSNSAGQLGDGTTRDRNTPVNVAGLTSGVAEVSVGGAHTCALTTAEGLRCWGVNDRGYLGDGTTFFQRREPVDVVGLTGGVAAVSAGVWHTCAVTAIGGLGCWGRGTEGWLGDGTTTDNNTPANVIGFLGVVAVLTPTPIPTPTPLGVPTAPTPSPTPGATTTPPPTSTPTPTQSPKPTVTFGPPISSGGNGFPTEVIVVIISTAVAVITAFLGYRGIRTARRHP
ncbi:MAG: chromosome condensation regulator RCC1 [Chloroflexi bacterium]|nr:chromosome condensation regulator RCC1 [Chloroflexota bacterium]